jgi:hypothetical protein
MKISDIRRKLMKSNVLCLGTLLSFVIDLYFYYRRERPTRLKRQLADSLQYFRAKPSQGGKDGILLIEMTRDFEYTIKLGAASKAIAERLNLSVRLHDPSIYWTKKDYWINSVCRFFSIDTYEMVHLAFADDIVFRNADKYYNQAFIKKELKTIQHILQDKKPEYILSLQFDNILVGDLIYDTYLRFYHKPTIREINNDVLRVVEVALNIFYKFKDYLKSENVKAVLNIYTSYIHHGITARLCLDHDIAVYAIGSISYVIQKLTKGFPYHQLNHSLFNESLVLNSYQHELVRKRLEARFSGRIDQATSYMRRSAFSDSPISEKLEQLFRLRKRNIIIYTHDFYDSPHINRMLQFPDLYEYLKQTLMELTDLKDTSVFIKIHPNGMPGGKEETIDIVNSFSAEHYHILDESVSNLHIIQLRPDLICTARGTVGIEMAYFEIPTVALFDNLYSNFNFVHTCQDKDSYFSIIRGESMPSVNYDKDKILSFYYQAYMEKKVREENNIFEMLSFYTFTYDTYSDLYLDEIFKIQNLIFDNRFVNYYKEFSEIEGCILEEK